MYSKTAYYPSTGQIAEINNISDGNPERLVYKYDPWGNIKHQELNPDAMTPIVSASETFTYDKLHRLIEANGHTIKSYSYDAIGNITSKSDFSNNYIYGQYQSSCTSSDSNLTPGPNAISRANNLVDNMGQMSYEYDKKGNRIQDCLDGVQRATYTYDYNNLLIESTSNITTGGNNRTLEFNYGTDNQRYRKFDDSNLEITLYGNKDYERIFNGTEIQNKYYLTSYLTITRSNQAAKKVNFMQKDRLGSTTQILDEDGFILHTKSYDAFGKPRNGDWSDMGTVGNQLFKAMLEFSDTNGTIDLTKRGFTDHEHLDEMQLIHMNGRMYDYNNGRFLSVDPFITNPTSTQALNPYTYIFNNPLSGVDPTGYKPVCILKCSDWNSVKKLDGILANISITSKNGANLKITIALTDQAISELDNIIEDFIGGLSYGETMDLMFNSSDAQMMLGELQSFRKLLEVNKELTDKYCKPDCKGNVSPEMINHYAKLFQSFGINASMGTMGPKFSSTKSVSKIRISQRNGVVLESNALHLPIFKNYTNPKQGFSGVWDKSTGKFAMRPSTTNRRDTVPDGWVSRGQGHGDIKNEFFPEGHRSDLFGFTAFKQNGGLRLEFNSGSVNFNNGGFRGTVVPENLRQPIIDSIARGTGMKVFQ